MARYNPDYISLFSNSKFRDNVIKRRNVSREQLLAYRDFQSNFNERIDNVEQFSYQMPIEKRLSKSQMVNLYSAHIQDKFTPKQFAEITNMNKNTARRELQKGVSKGILERTKKGEYRYK